MLPWDGGYGLGSWSWPASLLVEAVDEQLDDCSRMLSS